MNKTIIVSNRLPLQLTIEDKKLKVSPSVGGLATGLKSVHAEGNGLWIGWSGLTEDELNADVSKKVNQAISKEKCATVPLTKQDIDMFYLGFSNKALWPLFHYFLEFAEFESEQWNAYKRVNQKFADTVLEHVNDGDTIWVQDYQLLLVPQLIKEKKPDVTIGFFLHIPFPSYEIFRVFPWREDLLKGMVGADLIGFHTYDYERHFLSSVKRILRLEMKFNDIYYDDRIVKVDSFPMGIDYDKFHQAATAHHKQSPSERSELHQKLETFTQSNTNTRLILSIDRMDYTKGIPNRILAFEYFLKKYPEYKEKVRLVMLAVPSRSDVPQYMQLKRDIDELVGRINGQFGTVSWTPIWYFYRSMPFENLIDLYTSSHIAMITPVRDGMNLVAKEYVASRVHKDGVLILSEMAGAAKEMNEALLINPNNFEQIAQTLKKAIEMPLEEQQKRMEILQERLQRYTVEKWANEFMKSLNETKHYEVIAETAKFDTLAKDYMLDSFNNAKQRLLFLDYDGTLTGFQDYPDNASPDDSLIALLDQLNALHDTDIVIISGRDKETFTNWFERKPYNLISDHGVWLKEKNQTWNMIEHLKTDWKEHILPVLETFTDRTPGTFIEKKEYSLAWHYRKADPELSQTRVVELNTVLTSLISSNDLSVLNGNKVIEIKSSIVNKGRAALRWIGNKNYDFIFAIGDDWTDEFMFEELPDDAFTVKIGFDKTAAKYYIKDSKKVRELLTEFISN